VSSAEARRNIDLAYGRAKALRDAFPDASPWRLDATYVMKRLVDAKKALTDPAPPPPPPVRPVRKKGAIVINAGNASPELLRQAGITHVAVEYNVANLDDFLTGRWDGFTKGVFVVSRGNDGDSIANIPFGAYFAIIDTESHKTDMGGSLAWTETLYAALRSKLGAAYPLYNITFGVHSSPAVVNHDAWRKHNISPIFETYDGAGQTLGVARTVSKANSEGWTPAHVALGDKSLAAECAEAKALSGLGDVWAWAPEQAGVDILELAKVPTA
jgi:hypothetical protein